MERRSLDRIRRRYDELSVQDPRVTYEVLSPSDADVYLFRTSDLGCLTHIVRYVLDSVADYRWWTNGGYQRTLEAECGVHGSTGSVRRRGDSVVINPADETFGCHLCIASADRHGLPTFGLIPDTGCAATGGERFRPRLKRRLTAPRGRPEIAASDRERFVAALDAIDCYVKSLDKPGTA